MPTFSNTQIAIDTLPKLEDIELDAISPKYFKIITINTVFVYLVGIALLIAMHIFVEDTVINTIFWFVLGALLLLCVLTLVLYRLGFKKRKYALRTHDISYAEGFFNYKLTTLPFNKIQHIEVSRSVLQRKFELSSLKVYSAGESGGDLVIKGLSKTTAQKLYNHLTSILNARV